ncbi:MAG: nitrogenase component 1 [Methanothrix sp.]|jgi:nitrogenase molybdenum-iron protein alpha/beta subunit
MSFEAYTELRNITLDHTFNGIQQAASPYYHRFGLNCKLSGSVYAVSEIDGAIPIMHGPAGCAFHQRLTPMKLYSPVNELPSTNLDENDVIYGGEGKLRKAIIETSHRYKPSMIAVLPTCVSGLIGDDVSGVCDDIKSEISCPLISVSSEGFAHRSRESLDTIISDMAKAWKTAEPPDYDLKGCGQEEVVLSLVSQLMEEQDISEDLVNIEYSGRFRYGSRRDLEETRRLFGLMGVRINTTILSCNVEQIKHAPAAALNIVSRHRKAAKLMSERFGTGYFHKWAIYYGLEGIERFYSEVGSRLDRDGEAECMIDQEKKQAFVDIDNYLKAFRDQSFALSTQAFFFTPDIARIYIEDLQLPLRYICVNTQMLRSMNISEETIQLMIESMTELFGKRDYNLQIIVDPTLHDVWEVAKSVDFHLSDRITPPINQNENHHVILDVSRINHLLFSTSFKGIAEFAGYLAGYLNKGMASSHGSIISQFEYDALNYPFVEDPRCSASRAMWSNMWALKCPKGD